VILVAEDDVLIRTLITCLITSLHETPLAPALAAVQTHGPTLAGAILDVVMPHTSGIAVAAAIQQHGLTIPVILMSGAIPAQHLLDLRALRRITLLPKPFDLTDLRTLIQLMIPPP
jgi:CheY-like chemotaxis protein